MGVNRNAIGADLVMIDDQSGRDEFEQRCVKAHAIWPSMARSPTPLESLRIHRPLHQKCARALQVADRWHLLANMRQAVERWLHGAHARLRRLPPVPGSAPLAPRRDQAFARSAPERDASAESRARWQAVYDGVRRRHASGEPLLGIAHAMGVARATVRKYAAANTFPARLSYGPGPSLLDPHVDHLVRRIGEGCENAMALWRELRERGYPGTSRQVHRFVAKRRTKPTRSGRKPRQAATLERPTAGPPLPTSRQLAWLLVQPISALDAVAAAVVAHVEQDPTARAVTQLARRFTALVRASGVGKRTAEGRAAVADLDAWVTEAKACDASAIASFAAGLNGDASAVRAASGESHLELAEEVWGLSGGR